MYWVIFFTQIWKRVDIHCCHCLDRLFNFRPQSTLAMKALNLLSLNVWCHTKSFYVALKNPEVWQGKTLFFFSSWANTFLYMQLDWHLAFVCAIYCSSTSGKKCCAQRSKSIGVLLQGAKITSLKKKNLPFSWGDIMSGLFFCFHCHMVLICVFLVLCKTSLKHDEKSLLCPKNHQVIVGRWQMVLKMLNSPNNSTSDVLRMRRGRGWGGRTLFGGQREICQGGMKNLDRAK